MEHRMQNYWVSHRDFFVTWGANFPAVSTPSDIENLLTFAEKVIQAGEREQVLRVLETTAGFDRASGQSYIQFLQKTFEETGRMPFFDLFDKAKLSARLSFYNLQGTVVEDDIEDVGLLLRQLRPQEAENHFHRGHYMATLPAIEIFGSYITPNEPTKTPHLGIALATDIWMPWVVGFLERSDYTAKFDNHELALRHSPRFNAFLAAVQQPTLKANG